MHKRNEVKEYNSIYSLTQLEETFTTKSLPSFVNLLDQSDSIEIIAEIKKGSPSKGLFAPNLNVKEVTNAYTLGGAAALSVLTDVNFFYGSYKNLMLARENTTLPILCKDFILDKIQIALAKHYGATMVLLIVAALDPSKIKELYEYAYSIGLEVIFEIHSINEYHIIKDFDIRLLGINNRNLKTFNTSVDTTIDIIKKIQDISFHIVSESGIKTENDVKRLAQYPISALLIGETLIQSDNKINVISSLRKRKNNGRI